MNIKVLLEISFLTLCLSFISFGQSGLDSSDVPSLKQKDIRFEIAFKEK